MKVRGRPVRGSNVSCDEASVNIINQLQKAKVSMTPFKVLFRDGSSCAVEGHYAAILLDRFADMKPMQKQEFQKKIGHSFHDLKSEL